jgi:drug/metabolite transporter (DMT)-like permease
LILFGMVQVTMIGAAVKSGERPGLAQSLGLAAAVLGLVYLVLPGISAPDPGGALLMALAGMAWGVYSIRGRGAASPTSMTAGNFLRSVPAALVASAVALPTIHGELAGLLLALVSGVVTSGLGYVLWYRALKNLTTMQASVVQLVVPVLAAFGGVVFLSEQVSTRLVAASALILGGVATTLVRGRSVPRRT